MKAACAKSGIPGARQRLARLLDRLPKARRQHLTAKGKLLRLLALPDARLARVKLPRLHWKKVAAQRRKLTSMAPEARLATLNRFLALRRQGVCNQVAAAKAGLSVSSAWKFQRRLALGGIAGLAPQFHRAGRKAAVATVPDATLAAIRRLHVELGSNVAAWRAYLARPECPADLRTALGDRPVPARLLATTRVKRVPVQCFTAPGLLAVGPLPGAKEKFHFLSLTA